MGYPTPPEVLEELWEALDTDFALWPVDDHVQFLADLPTDRATVVLERAHKQLPDRLFHLLPPRQQTSLVIHRKDEAKVLLSA